MDRRQDGTAATIIAACPVPAPGSSVARRTGYAAGGREARRGAAVVRPPRASLPRSGTATGAAPRDTGSARRRFSHDRPCPIPARPHARGRARNATTEILTR